MSIKTSTIGLKTFSGLGSVGHKPVSLSIMMVVYPNHFSLKILTKNKFNFVLQVQQYLALEGKPVGELLSGL